MNRSFIGKNVYIVHSSVRVKSISYPSKKLVKVEKLHMHKGDKLYIGNFIIPDGWYIESDIDRYMKYMNLPIDIEY